jgi:hypothetical protein
LNSQESVQLRRDAVRGLNSWWNISPGLLIKALVTFLCVIEKPLSWRRLSWSPGTEESLQWNECNFLSFSTSFVCFYSTGVWTQGLALAMQGLYHFSHSPSPFCLFIFQIKASDFCLVWPGSQSFYFCFPCSWDGQMWATTPSFYCLR